MISVISFFCQLLEQRECISFDAVQLVPIGLLQPAPAVFYDYYEPGKFFSIIFLHNSFEERVSKLFSIIYEVFVLSLQTESALCSILPHKEAKWSPNCVQGMFVNVQKVGHSLRLHLSLNGLFKKK